MLYSVYSAPRLIILYGFLKRKLDYVSSDSVCRDKTPVALSRKLDVTQDEAMNEHADRENRAVAEHRVGPLHTARQNSNFNNTAVDIEIY